MGPPPKFHGTWDILTADAPKVILSGSRTTIGTWQRSAYATCAGCNTGGLTRRLTPARSMWT